MPNSPAAKAGIKPYDIVTEINNQSLKSTDDLAKTIVREPAGQTVTMQVVRALKAEQLKVTLGERTSSAVIRGQSPAESSAPNGQKSANNRASADHSALTNHQASANDQASTKSDDVELESFDALTLERTGKDQYQAEIKFRDKQGKVETCKFKGSRDEIRKDIMEQQNLPKSERHQLLGSLRLPVDFELTPESIAAPTAALDPSRFAVARFRNCSLQPAETKLRRLQAFRRGSPVPLASEVGQCRARRRCAGRRRQSNSFLRRARVLNCPATALTAKRRCGRSPRR